METYSKRCSHWQHHFFVVLAKHNFVMHTTESASPGECVWTQWGWCQQRSRSNQCCWTTFDLNEPTTNLTPSVRLELGQKGQIIFGQSVWHCIYLIMHQLNLIKHEFFESLLLIKNTYNLFSLTVCVKLNRNIFQIL